MRSASRFAIVTALVAVGTLATVQSLIAAGTLKGKIGIDGSSTVYPITEAVSEEFGKVEPGVRVTVGVSGTGGGFKRFTIGEIDISDASRPIKDSEMKIAVENGIDFIEIPVAYDGLSIVVSNDNDFIKQLTVDQLKKIFLEKSAAKSWKDVDASFPDVAIKIYSPGTDSGTFDYFKEVVAGKEDSIRPDMSVSEDDNVLVRGVTGDKGAIGFFGSAYYFANKDKLRAVAIVNKAGKAVVPTPETIESGEYNPFSRPLFIYVASKAAKRPEVKAFVEFYLEHAAKLSDEVGYVRLPSDIYDRARSRFAQGVTGTSFLDKDMKPIHGPLREVYK